MRGRNRNNGGGGNKGPNPLTKSYESNGPDVKIRGTAQHIAEKYSQLARDAQASGDPVAAENYFQHAEHYFRIIAAAQEQLREQYGYQQRFEDEGDEEGFSGDRPSFERTGAGTGEDGDFGSQPQPYETRGEGERPARFDRGDRQDRGERGDRRERFQRDRGPRQDRQGQDRQDFQRDDQAGEGERPARFDRQDRPERGERQDRPERGDRRERFQRDRRPREEAESSDGGSLPAFLTNPVRSAPAASEDQVAAPTLDFGNEGGDDRPRRRTRRPRRDMIEGGEEAGNFAPDVETPAAE